MPLGLGYVDGIASRSDCRQGLDQDAAQSIADKSLDGCHDGPTVRIIFRKLAASRGRSETPISREIVG